MACTACCALADPESENVCQVKPRKPGPGEVSRAVELYPPWSKSECIMLRFPETALAAGHGWLFMCNWPGHGPSPMQPNEPPTSWKRGKDGSLGYIRAMDGDRCAGGPAAGMQTDGAEVTGIAYGGRLMPRADCIDIEFFTRNGTDETFAVAADFCLVCSRNGEWITDGTSIVNKSSGEFSDYQYERTYIYTSKGWLRLRDGDRGPHDKTYTGRWAIYPVKGGPDLGKSSPDHEAKISTDAADEGIIAVVSSLDSRRIMAMAWTNPHSIMNNVRGPCVHCSPILPKAPAHGVSRTTGRIYFLRGTLDDLYTRYLKDFGQLKDQQTKAAAKASASGAQ